MPSWAALLFCSPRIDGSVGYVYTNRNGRDGIVADPTIPTDVFDMSYQRLQVSANFLLARPLLLSTTVTVHDGDFVSACIRTAIGLTGLIGLAVAVVVQSVARYLIGFVVGSVIARQPTGRAAAAAHGAGADSDL